MAMFSVSEQHNQVPRTPAAESEQDSSAFLHRLNSDKFSELNDDELLVLALLATKTLRDRGACTAQLTALNKTNDVWDNAKLEQIICNGLKPRYDGSPSNLIPTLNMIHIRRQNEVWFAATFVIQDGQKIDIIRNFSQVRKETILNQAKCLWDDPASETQRYVRGTATFNARLLSVFLMNSLTHDFAALLHSRIDPAYSSDGPLLLFVMCNHIHRNHIAFVESIKNKIRTTTLAEHKNDMQEYLRLLQENLRLITSTGVSENVHGDLVSHIFLQLRLTKIPVFQQIVLQWHRNYMENKLKVTPSELVQMADDECQVLKHSNQWVDTIDPLVLAMQAVLQATQKGSTDVFQQLAAHFGEISKQQQDLTCVITHSSGKQASYAKTPEWMYSAPSDLSQLRLFNCRQWYFCTKCGRSGRWVCTHMDATHRSSRDRDHRRPQHDYKYQHRRHFSDNNDPDGYRSSDSSSSYSRNNYRDHSREDKYRNRSRSRSPFSRDRHRGNHSPHKVTFRPGTPQPSSAHLSLLESINTLWQA